MKVSMWKVVFACIIGLVYADQEAHMIKIGHRGAMGYEPENTLRSFEKAIAQGVDMIELDVHCCKTGELVVIHDFSLERTTNGKGLVEDAPLAELQKLDAGKGERIPTLEQVFDLIARRIKINIELKGKHTALPVAALINRYVAEKQWAHTDFMVSSFDHKELQRFKTACPQVVIAPIISSRQVDEAAFGTRAGAEIVVVNKQYVDELFVADAHQRNLLVYVYTLNTQEDIVAMKALGVDGLISNYPDRLN